MYLVAGRPRSFHIHPPIHARSTIAIGGTVSRATGMLRSAKPDERIKAWRWAADAVSRAGPTHHFPVSKKVNSLPCPPVLPAVRHGFIGVVVVLAAAVQVPAGCLEPREIPLTQRNVAPRLEAATRPEPVERGIDRPLVDGLGWAVGIPRKIILWDIRVANHHVSSQTEKAIAEYLTAEAADHSMIAIAGH